MGASEPAWIDASRGRRLPASSRCRWRPRAPCPSLRRSPPGGDLHPRHRAMRFWVTNETSALVAARPPSPPRPPGFRRPPGLRPGRHGLKAGIFADSSVAESARLLAIFDQWADPRDLAFADLGHGGEADDVARRVGLDRRRQAVALAGGAIALDGAGRRARASPRNAPRRRGLRKRRLPSGRRRTGRRGSCRKASGNLHPDDGSAAPLRGPPSTDNGGSLPKPIAPGCHPRALYALGPLAVGPKRPFPRSGGPTP